VLQDHYDPGAGNNSRVGIVIMLTNDLHATRCNLFGVSIGDTVAARRAGRIRLELCGIVGCDECDSIGSHGPQDGFEIIERWDGGVILQPVDDDPADTGDFEGIPTQGVPSKNGSESISRGRLSDSDTENGDTQAAKPNPVSLALENLINLRRHLVDLPADLAEWLDEGINDYLIGSSPSLDQALCLCRPISGTVPANTMHQRRTRNRHLVSAAELLAPDGTAWQRSGALLGAIRHYDLGGLPAGSVHDHIEAAYETGLRIPSSQVGLSEIISARK
jgi:hypothetical protein